MLTLELFSPFTVTIEQGKSEIKNKLYLLSYWSLSFWVCFSCWFISDKRTKSYLERSTQFVLQFCIIQSQLPKLKDLIEFDMCTIKAVRKEKKKRKKKRSIREEDYFKWKSWVISILLCLVFWQPLTIFNAICFICLQLMCLYNQPKTYSSLLFFLYFSPFVSIVFCFR